MRIPDHRRHCAPPDLATLAAYHVLDHVVCENVWLHTFNKILVHRVLPDLLCNRPVERIGAEVEFGHVLLEARADDAGVHDEDAHGEGG